MADTASTPGTARAARKAKSPGTTLAVTCGLRGSLGRRRGLVELSAQVADLVAQLRRVLEPQLLRRREHLLLERDDRLLDLVRLHVDPLLAPAAAPARRHLALAHEELRDVGDPLDDRLRRDAALGVVRLLDRAPAVGLVDRPAHR